MRYAIFSDIHGNHQAWQAVLADMRENHAEVLVCLGDAVGYGPKPLEVLTSIRQHTENFVLGNHDAAACGRLDPSYFNENAQAGIALTIAQLDEDSLNYLRAVPYALSMENLLFVHAEAAQPNRFDYVINVEKAVEDFAATPHVCTFLGHTHHPLVFVESQGKVVEQPDQDFQFQSGQRYIVNVGSVGEPRNPEDIRARYVLYDDDTQTVYFRRVEFDTEAYREDLRASGSQAYPYFLQILDEKIAGQERLALFLNDMRTVQVVPGERVEVEQLQLPPRITISEASRQVTRRSFGATLGWLVALVLLAAGGWFAYQTWNPDARRERNDPLGIASAPEVNGTVISPFGEQLLGYWPLDGSSKGFAGTAAFQGFGVGSLQSKEGKFGSAIRFQPDSGLVFGNERAFAVGNQPLSLSFWVQIAEPQEQEARLVGTGARNRSDPGWIISLQGDFLAFRLNNGSVPAQLGGPVPSLSDGGWHHLALVIDPGPGQLLAYYDGQALGQIGIGSLAPPIPSRHALILGHDQGGTPGFSGTLDELALWRRALSASEVETLFQSTSPLATP